MNITRRNDVNIWCILWCFLSSFHLDSKSRECCNELGVQEVYVDIYSCPHRGKHVLSLPADSIRQLIFESEGQIWITSEISSVVELQCPLYFGTKIFSFFPHCHAFPKPHQPCILVKILKSWKDMILFSEKPDNGWFSIVSYPFCDGTYFKEAGWIQELCKNMYKMNSF